MAKGNKKSGNEPGSSTCAQSSSAPRGRASKKDAASAEPSGTNKRLKRKRRTDRSSSTSSLERNGGEGGTENEIKHQHQVREPKFTFDELKGINGFKDQLLEGLIAPFCHPEKAAKINLDVPRGVLLTGPPGTGKSSLADGIVSEIRKRGKDVKYYFETGSILSSYLGESEKRLRKLFETAAKTAPSVIFFDELDGLGGQRSDSSGNSAMNTIVTTFLTQMDSVERGKVLVIGVTNHPELCDEALIRPGRFDIRLILPLPDLEGRAEILKHKLQKKGVTVTTEKLEEICQGMDGFSGSDLEVLVKESWTRFIRRVFPGRTWTSMSDEALAENLQSKSFDMELDVRPVRRQMKYVKMVFGTAKQIKTEQIDDNENEQEALKDYIASMSVEDTSNETQQGADRAHNAVHENVGDQRVEEDNQYPIYGDFQTLVDTEAEEAFEKIFSYLSLWGLKQFSVLSKGMRQLVFPSLITSSSFRLLFESERNDFVDFLQTKVLPLTNKIKLSLFPGDFKNATTLLHLFAKFGSHINHLRVSNYYDYPQNVLERGYKNNICVIASGSKLFPSLESISIVVENRSNTIYSNQRYDNQPYDQVELIHSILGNAPALKKIHLRCSLSDAKMTTLLFRWIEEFGLDIKVLGVTGLITDIGLGYLKHLSLKNVHFHAHYKLNEADSFTNFLESQRKTLKHLSLWTPELRSKPEPEFTFPRMEMLETLELRSHYVDTIGEQMVPIFYKDEAPKLETIKFSASHGEIEEEEFFHPFFASEPTRSVKEVIFSIPNIHSINISECGRIFECLTKLTIPVHEGLVCVWKDLTNLEELTFIPSEVYEEDESMLEEVDIWIDEIITGIPVRSVGSDSVFTEEERKNYEKMYDAAKSIEMLKKLRLLRLRPSSQAGYQFMLSDLPFRMVFNKMESLKCIDFCGLHPKLVGASKEVLEETGRKIRLLFGKEPCGHGSGSCESLCSIYETNDSWKSWF